MIETRVLILELIFFNVVANVPDIETRVAIREATRAGNEAKLAQKCLRP